MNGSSEVRTKLGASLDAQTQALFPVYAGPFGLSPEGAGSLGQVLHASLKNDDGLLPFQMSRSGCLKGMNSDHR